MSELDNIIINLLLLDGNETCLLDDVEDYTCFRRLIIELVKIKYDVRWCNNENCSCHPESAIKDILEDNPEFYMFLKKYIKVDIIEKYINDYEVITVFDRNYVK